MRQKRYRSMTNSASLANTRLLGSSYSKLDRGTMNKYNSNYMSNDKFAFTGHACMGVSGGMGREIIIEGGRELDHHAANSIHTNVK